ncbi:YesL family protein [Gracilibacillus sp. HCP3S3_G5_1]|uniref:YesL family protein n=1 Tax=unclassified Gracilibacillus TaxID=2625209 RepID=UPI003F8878B2
MNVEGGLTKAILVITEWITRLFSANIIWLLFNLPVILFSVNVAFADSRHQLTSIIVILLLIAPFITFPATVALFTVVRRWTMEDTTIPVFQSYRKYWKENYKNSIIAGFIIEGFWLIYAADYYFFTTNISPSLALVLIILGVVFLMITLFFMCSLAHSDLPIKKLLKNSTIMVISHPFLTVSIGVFNLSIVYISFMYAPYLLILFLGSSIAFVTFSGFYKIYRKVELIKNRSI